VPVALRVNPDVAAGGHHKISTGRKTDKFGIAAERAPALYRRVAAHAHLEPVGIAMHIGSQIRDIKAFAAAFERMAEMAEGLRAAGLEVPRIDLGGGLAVAYGEGERDLPLADYGALLARIGRRTGARLMIEPGRWLVAGAGVLVTRVITVKQAGDKRFVVVDAAMNDLIRPTLYDARHPVWTVRQAAAEGAHPATVAGPICESGDVLAVDCPLPTLEPGELIAIGMAGAYGAVMASTYNARLLVPEAMVRGGALEVVRRRPSYEEAMALDRLPSWVEQGVA
jgi:diaminopimelate decarboxylase